MHLPLLNREETAINRQGLAFRLKSTQDSFCLNRGVAYILDMQASLVTQPDGSSALLVSGSDRGVSDPSSGAPCSRKQPTFPHPLSSSDPFNAQDVVAQRELVRMRQEDASMRAQHAPIDAVSLLRNCLLRVVSQQDRRVYSRVSQDLYIFQLKFIQAITSVLVQDACLQGNHVSYNSYAVSCTSPRPAGHSKS